MLLLVWSVGFLTVTNIPITSIDPTRPAAGEVSLVPGRGFQVHRTQITSPNPPESLVNTRTLEPDPIRSRAARVSVLRRRPIEQVWYISRSPFRARVSSPQAVVTEA